MDKKETFSKQERLCSPSRINLLFQSKKSFLIYPLSVHWTITTDPLPSRSQVLLVVAKKRMKRAVDRNHIKRLLRESFRKNKHPLYAYLSQHSLQILFSIAYIGDDIPSYKTIEKQTEKVIRQLIQSLEK